MWLGDSYAPMSIRLEIVTAILPFSPVYRLNDVALLSKEVKKEAGLKREFLQKLNLTGHQIVAVYDTCSKLGSVEPNLLLVCLVNQLVAAKEKVVRYNPVMLMERAEKLSNFWADNIEQLWRIFGEDFGKALTICFESVPFGAHDLISCARFIRSLKLNLVNINANRNVFCCRTPGTLI
jgi:hypothetical protein